jgi:hypothetical protein
VLHDGTANKRHYGVASGVTHQRLTDAVSDVLREEPPTKN